MAASEFNTVPLTANIKASLVGAAHLTSSRLKKYAKYVFHPVDREMECFRRSLKFNNIQLIYLIFPSDL